MPWCPGALVPWCPGALVPWWALSAADGVGAGPAGERFNGVIARLAHREFAELPPEGWQPLLKSRGVLLDLKGIVPRELGPLRL